MKEYICVLQGRSAIEALRDHPNIQKVGRPRSLHNRVIVETTLAPGHLLELPGVIGVEDGEQPVDMARAIDEPADGWALPWISDTGGNYQHSHSGEGVDIYVLDTGVRADHAEFTAGQVETIHTYDGNECLKVDDNTPWHGTAVASCAAGQTLGIARDARIFSLRVQWTVSGIIKALDVALRHHLDKPDERPSVLNFSGSSLSSMLGDAFADVVSYGVVSVAAAGNDYEDQPRYPARAIWTLAVGALEADESRAGFSNKRAEVYAPGHNVRMADNNTATSIIHANGTSFASPFVAGLIACNLEGSHKFNTRKQVSDLLWSLQNNVWDRGRVDPFDNGGIVVRTAATDTVPGMPFYQNPSFAYTDAEIAQFINDNVHQSQVIADAARDGNVSCKRMARSMGVTEDRVDGWFADHGVEPWWYVGG